MTTRQTPDSANPAGPSKGEQQRDNDAHRPDKAREGEDESTAQRTGREEGKPRPD
ncbi:hypothetical protein [Pseudomonas sp.]|uniref:hypothetical protein n=1 Tax=Pseudomonas sp. TaxID=306 RepID=UPI0028B0E803|nr:hypothetical protein [Pseudomonas sp.]